MGSPRDDVARWLGVRDTAARPAVEAALRAALVTLRNRLARVEIDVCSDDGWPASVRDDVRAAERRLGRRRAVTVTLDPGADEDLDLALALAPYSICCTGIGADGEIVWDVNDTGTSVAFRLTPAEETSVRGAVVGAGGHPDDLAPLAVRGRPRRDRGSL